MDNYLLYKLINIDGFGAKTISIILDRIKTQNITLEDFFKLKEKEFNNLFHEFGKGRFKKVNFDNFSKTDDNVLKEKYNSLLKNGVKIITCFNKEYPEIIINYFQGAHPSIIFCKGNIDLLKSNSVAIVGSRNIDNKSLNTTKKIAQYLVGNKYNVISGYAKGVDTSAHLGALEAGGTTIAVLNCGINQALKKKEIQELNNQTNNLLLISQFRPDEPWSAGNAMTRNKLVCAMSKAVIVISSGPEKDEKGKMSGTFNAGKTALKLGIPLLVLSPSFFDIKPGGNIELIKMGGREIIDLTKINELIKSVPVNKEIQSQLF